MRNAILPAMLLATLTVPALADNYPVSGQWGQSSSGEQGAIDCSGKRVIAFNGNQRTDSKGGVPTYRNKSVTQQGPSRWRVVDIFTTGQVSYAYATYTLHQIDADHIELNLQPGGTVKLRRCK